jgi:hypothetical protein
LLTFLAAILLFGVTFARRYRRAEGFLALLNHLAGGLGAAITFIGLVGIGYALLNINFTGFDRDLHAVIRGGTEVDRQRAAWEKQWGPVFVQRELTVAHTVQRQEVVEVPGPEGKTLYRNVTRTDYIEQESIRGFDGEVEIRLIDPAFNRYILDARYEYLIANEADEETVAEMRFPLSTGQLYENVRVVVDGVDQETGLVMDDRNLLWKVRMAPGQVSKVRIPCTVRGTGAYYYRINTQRSIENFRLQVITNTQKVYFSNNPRLDALNPLWEDADDGTGRTFLWSLDRMVMAPSIGVYFFEAPKTALTDKAARVARYSPRALGLLAVLIVLSMMILSIPVDLSRLALSLGIFCGQFLALMGFGILGGNYLAGLLASGLAAGALQLILWWRRPYAQLILSLVALFGLGYPFAGLLQQEGQRNAFDGLVLTAIILYLFALILFARLRRKIVEPAA